MKNFPTGGFLEGKEIGSQGSDTVEKTARREGKEERRQDSDFVIVGVLCCVSMTLRITDRLL